MTGKLNKRKMKIKRMIYCAKFIHSPFPSVMYAFKTHPKKQRRFYRWKRYSTSLGFHRLIIPEYLHRKRGNTKE